MSLRENIRQLRWKLTRMAAVPRNYFYCRKCRVQWRPSWRFGGLPIFRIAATAKISIGEEFCAQSKIAYNSIGVSQPVILTAWGKNSEIRIGNHVGMSGCSITAMRLISIGNRVTIGSGALIVDSDLHSLDPDERYRGEVGEAKPVIIEDEVFIGARAIVLKGVTIGRGAVVGAGAVVSRNVPPMTIVAGNPAKVVRNLERGPDRQQSLG